MTTPQYPNAARLMPLLVVGIMLNTLGIVLASLGTIRFVLMGVGVALILSFIVKGLANRSPNKP